MSRAEAREVVARAIFAHDGLSGGGEAWDDMPEDVLVEFRDQADAALDAVLGLLPKDLAPLLARSIAGDSFMEGHNTALAKVRDALGGAS